MLVQVALPVPLRSAFTYAVPDPLAAQVKVGVRVRVPFGKRRLVGLVLEEAQAPPPGAEIKPIEAVLDSEPVLPRPLLDLTLWVASYYHAPVGEAVRLALPPMGAHRAPSRGPLPLQVIGPEGRDAARALSGAAAAGEGLESLVRLAPGTDAGRLALDRRAKRLRAVLDTLAARGGPGGWMSREELMRISGASSSHLKRLSERGWVEIGVRDETPLKRPGGSLVEGPVLTPAQERAAGAIVDAIDAGSAGVWVLRGVTGSGKTEVYFGAARRALDRGLGVIFLVPEIGLTPLFVRRVRERFGEQVALLHSRLAPRARQEAWSRARSGAAPLVVGPRSALFAPVSRVGLIVVDEEHDPSYKQEETPRYHARDMALVRARLEGAVAVLGSATPSLESWQAAVAGRFHPLELGERIARRPMPLVEVVDMREEFRRRGAPVLLSAALTSALAEARSRGEQAVILLNRRGYAAFALCRACGEPIGCPRCSVSLVYHRSDESLRCHYCDHRTPRPSVCPSCESPHLLYQGEGTERVERHLEREIPGLRAIRLDRDTARARGAHERVLASFEAGDHDVLVGTQMVAKGHDFPGVTVVGVLAADAILGFPDFRAAERTFQLLTQVAGRAGRGERPGRVIVQAYRKDHYAIQTAVHHDHQGFFARETIYRRSLAYPPFTHLAAVTVSGRDLARTAARAKMVATLLASHGRARVRVLGPALAPLARLRGRYRFQILLKARARRRLGDALGRTLEELSAAKGGTRDLLVDVDPLQLL